MKRLMQIGLKASFCVAMLLASTLPLFAGPRVMTNADVIDLTRGGVSEWNILALVLANESAFSLAARDVQELRRAGVSESIIEAMTLRASAPTAPQSNPVIRRTNRTTRRSSNPSTPRSSTQKKLTSADAERQRIQQYEAQQRQLAVSAEQERRAIEQYEAQKRTRQTGSMGKGASQGLTQDDERRMIEEFEGQRGAVTVSAPDDSDSDGTLSSEEELRRIREFEAKQHPR